MVSPTRIMLVLHLLRKNAPWTLFVMHSIFKTYCDDFWKNVIPVDGRSSHSLVGMPIMRLHDASSTFMSVFFLFLHQRGCSYIVPASYFWMLLYPLWYFHMYSIHCFPHSEPFFHNPLGWCDHGFFRGFVYPLFFTFVIPSFPTLCEYKLVAGTFTFWLPIRVIIRLLI